MLGDLKYRRTGARSDSRARGCIEQTIRQNCPPQGFQRSEFLLEHGMWTPWCTGGS
jgi:acetyl-CoA carboxylase beta subunit